MKSVEEVDLSNFGKNQNLQNSIKEEKVQSAIIEDETILNSGKKRRRMYISLAIIIFVVIAVFIEWYFFIRIPKSDKQATPEQIIELLPKARLK